MKETKAKRKINKMLKIKDKGITLIALIVTIVVLLILAGVSVATLTGNNGLIKNVSEAEIQTALSEVREQLDLYQLRGEGNRIKNGDYSGKMSNEELVGTVFSKVKVTDTNRTVGIIKSKSIKDELKCETKLGKSKQKSEVQTQIDAGNLEDIYKLYDVFVVDFEDDILYYLKNNDLWSVEGERSQYTLADGSIKDAFLIEQKIAEHVEEEDKEAPNVSHTTTSVGIAKSNPATPPDGQIYTDSNGDKAPIPSGFKVSTVSTERTIRTGLVIKDDFEGSEFVWIPIDYPIATSESTAEQKAKTTTTIKITASDPSGIKSITNVTTDNITKNSSTSDTATYTVTENGDYVFKITDNFDNTKDYSVKVSDISFTTNRAMAIKTENGYRGLLYKYTTEGVTVKPTTTDFEPVSVSGDEDYGVTQSDLQNEYNSMITSVIKYKGFYIARYELSLAGATDSSTGPEDGKAQSKKGVKSSISTSAGTGKWYGLYAKAKTYTGTLNSVQSSMIWGSQNNAIANWIEKEKIHVDYSSDKRNSTEVSGAVETDKINNIYDFLGGAQEWSIAAYRETYRTVYSMYTTEATALPKDVHYATNNMIAMYFPRY